MLFPLRGSLGPLGRKYGAGAHARWENAVSIWRLDEFSSGLSGGVVRADVLGVDPLTDNNTVPSVLPFSGVLGAAGFYTSNSSALTGASTSLPNDLTVALWYRFPQGAGDRRHWLFSSYNSWVSATQVAVYSYGTDLNVVFGDGASYQIAGLARPADRGWHFVCVRFNFSTKVGSISVDDGAPVSTAALAGAPYRVAAPYFVGFTSAVASTSQAAQMETGVWNRELSSGEVTQLAAGVPFSLMSAGLKSGLAHYWEMDETTGNRVDSVGSVGLVPTAVVPERPLVGSNAASFARGNLEYLSSSGAVPPSESSFTLSLWAYFTALLDTNIIAGSGTAADESWQAYLGGDTKVHVGRVGQAEVTHPTALSANTWYHIVVQWDAAAGLLYAFVNADAGVSVALTGVHAAGNIFTIGDRQGGTQSGHTGLIDEPSWFSEFKDAAWRTGMYNGGAGRSYPD